MGFTGVGLGLPKDWIHIYLIKKKIRRWSTGIFLLKESISFSGSHFPNVSSSLKKKKKGWEVQNTWASHCTQRTSKMKQHGS